MASWCASRTAWQRGRRRGRETVTVRSPQAALVLLLGCLPLAACSLMPRYQPPANPAPAHYQQFHPATDCARLLRPRLRRPDRIVHAAARQSGPVSDTAHRPAVAVRLGTGAPLRSAAAQRLVARIRRSRAGLRWRRRSMRPIRIWPRRSIATSRRVRWSSKRAAHCSRPSTRRATRKRTANPTIARCAPPRSRATITTISSAGS